MKARYRPYNPKEGYFTLIDPEDIKNHNPLLKAIDSFVEEHIPQLVHLQISSTLPSFALLAQYGSAFNPR
jgi:hypothetical protein